MSRLGLSLLLLAAAALAGCGSGDDGDTGADTAPPAVAAQPVTPPGNPVMEALELNDWYRAILVDGAAITDPHQLEALARSYCEGLTLCRTAIWFDVANLPRAMPVDADALQTQAFAFGRTANGAENVLWNCTLYPQFEAEHACLPRVFQ
ncbi:MAG: hypothetical protein IT534_10510 [Bauldia sp.]|nr:hypothetical protein [Bauldia sp.]